MSSAPAAVPVASSGRAQGRQGSLEQQSIRWLVSRLEGVALFVQSAWIIITISTDNLETGGKVFLSIVAASHLAAALLAATRRDGGPSARGGPWLVAWIGAALLTPLVMATLIPYGQYGATTACTQLCGYPVPVIVMLAFYPWIQAGSPLLGRWVTGFILAGIVFIPLGVIVITHEQMAATNWWSWFNTILSYAGAFGLGIAIAIICRRAVQQVGASYQRAFSNYADVIHSDVGSALSALYLQGGNWSIESVRETLHDLDYNVRSKQRRFERSLNESVYLADLVQQVYLSHSRWIKGLALPQVGDWSVPGHIALDIELTLASFLKNVLKHASGSKARITCAFNEGELRIGVEDQGAGFDPAVFDVPDNDLHKRRQAARELGGDVEVGFTDGRTHIELVLPLQQDANGEEKRS